MKRGITRGAVFLADLNPRRGTEPGKTRPVLVLQTDLLNGLHPSTIVAPLTTRIEPRATYLRVHVKGKEGGLERDSDVMIDQIRAIDNRRLLKQLGTAPRRIMEAVSENVAALLDIATG